MSDEPQQRIFDGEEWLTPEEYSAKAQRVQQSVLMNSTANTHAIQQLLMDLSKDQLFALDMILYAIQSEQLTAGYYRGRVEQTLHIKHDHCPCGSHDPNDLIQGQPIDQTPLPQQKAPVIKSDNTFETPEGEVVTIGSRRYKELLVEWDLVELEDEDVPGRKYLRCICGLDYVSLADRMLRPKGVRGCGGCQHRAGHG